MSKTILTIIGVFIGALLVSLIFNYPIMLLWNWLAPIFHLPILTFWQMYGVQVLCNLLFKSTNSSSK